MEAGESVDRNKNKQNSSLCFYYLLLKRSRSMIMNLVRFYSNKVRKHGMTFVEFK